MHRVVTFLAIFIMLILLGIQSQADELHANLQQNHIETVGGELNIVKLQGSRYGGDYFYEIQIGGNLIARIDDADLVYVVGKWSSEKYKQNVESDHVLIFLDSGGNSCDGFYRFLQIFPNRKPNISPEFGTCFRANKITKIGNDWNFFIPNSGNIPDSVWQYRGSSLVKMEKDGKIQTFRSESDISRLFKSSVPDSSIRSYWLKKYGNNRDAYNAWMESEKNKKKLLKEKKQNGKQNINEGPPYIITPK